MLAIAVVLALVISHVASRDLDSFPESGKPACPQFPAFKSSSDDRKKLERELNDEIDSAGFLDKSVKRMQGAVQIPTESFDDMGPVKEDPRFDIFKDLHAYLEKTFPLV